MLPIDFIYYSSDNLFGTDLSDVSINYIDYMDYQDTDNIESKYLDKSEEAAFSIQLIKIMSLAESLLFILYISIIVLGKE